MKNKILLAAFLLFAGNMFVYGQECVMCYKSNGNQVAVGSSWSESRNGVTYTCKCTSSGPRCTSSSGGSSGSGGGYSSGNTTNEIMTNFVGNAFQALLNSLFNSSSAEESSSSSSSSSGSTYTAPALSQEEIDEIIAKQKAWKEQVSKLQGDYTKLVNEKFADQQKIAANDLKNRFVRSEAVKVIKKQNCTAKKHIGDARLVLNGKATLQELETPLENARASADFPNQPTPDCGEIEIRIPEVNVQNPVGFQQIMYQTIQAKADSISVSASLLQQRQVNLKKTIAEKKQEMQTLEEQPNKTKTDGKTKADILAALNAANEEEKMVEEEIGKNQKGLDALEKLRSTYDIPEKKN